jgi:hypothetical protein
MNMTEETARKSEMKVVKLTPVADALDINSLWLDPKLGDGIVDTHYHSIPVDKPKNFFRVHPDQSYRQRTEIVTIKPEEAIDEQHYIVAPSMRGKIDEARPCTLVVVVYRDGTPRLWPLKFPRDGERDNEAWTSARSAARKAIDNWVKLVWSSRTYQTREAQPGYAPDPDWSKLPEYNELVRLAFGEKGIIRDELHPVYRDLLGSAPSKANRDDDI